jgi:hypothetical protein
MLDFPIEPKDLDVHIFETQNFVFHSNANAWWPEGITEAVNTAIDRNYVNYYLSSGTYVTLDKAVLANYQAPLHPSS